jgi:hypothetical protein
MPLADSPAGSSAQPSPVTPTLIREHLGKAAGENVPGELVRRTSSPSFADDHDGLEVRRTGSLSPAARLIARLLPHMSRPELWLVLFLLAGAAVRLWRYVLDFPLWHDELMLVANFVEKDRLGLLGLLERKQVAPPAFLLAQQWIIANLGLSEASLRLLPLLAGLIALPLVARIAWLVLVTGPVRYCGDHRESDLRRAAYEMLPVRRTSSPSSGNERDGLEVRRTSSPGTFSYTPTFDRDRQLWNVVLAVGIFAASYFPIRYAGEVKPYSLDLAASAILLWLTLEWIFAPRRWYWPFALLVVTPLLVAVSFTAVLAAGGVAVGLGLWAIRRPSGPKLAVVGAFGLILAASFVVLRDFTSQPGQTALNGELTQYWANSFPPHSMGPDLWLWLVRSHTSELFAYPVGGQNGASLLTAVCVGIGAFRLVRQGNGLAVTMLAAMLGLLFIAAWLRKYPYGGHPRLVLFIAPLVCMLAAVGISTLLERLRAPLGQTGRNFLVAGLFLILAATVVRDGIQPWKSAVDARHRSFARAFWTLPIPEGWTTVALSRHRSQSSAPQLCDFAYRVEKALSLREPVIEMGRLVPAELHQTPLRCVVYQNATAPRHEGDYQVWRRAVAESHTVVAIDQYALPVLNDQLDDLYEVYWLVPNGQTLARPEPAATISGLAARTSPAEPPRPVLIATIEGRRL